jgi:hypothetical protein
MRILATFALAILTGTAVAATVENIIVKNGDHSYINGDVNDSTMRHLGQHYAAFELDGVRYAITDAATLEKIEKVMAPQVELGKRQAALGERQAELGGEQAKIGAEQARLGARQATTRNEARQRELAEQQRELAEEQRKLGDRQRELGDRQRELGDRQREAGRIAEKELEKIFRNSVASGVARRR